MILRQSKKKQKEKIKKESWKKTGKIITLESFDTIRGQKIGWFSLKNRLILLVSMELVVSVLLALALAVILNKYIFVNFEIPLLVELIVISLFIGCVVTSFLSKMFFDPIKKVRTAMGQVADGNFKVRLDTASSSQEIQEVYSGFNMMVQELSTTEILQTDFVSNVSHEFKTPINAIEGYATLLQDCDNLTEEQKEYVDKIYLNTKRLSHLVGNILLLSKVENQTISNKNTKFRLDEQIRQAIVLLEPEWGAKDIEFDADMQMLEYTGNEALLFHVWSNLIGNAIKFDPKGGFIRIKLVQQGEQIIFTIEDNGPGISEESKKHIFDKFYQIDSSHKQEGNGLGLALVKKILAVCDGEIIVENLEVGCRFTVKLQCCPNN